MICRRACLLGLGAAAAQTAWPQDRWQHLKAYHREQGGVGLVVLQNGQTLCEDGSGQAYDLASGTKSFWGPLAITLNLNLDLPVGSVLSEWSNDDRGQITLRQLLNLTAGLPDVTGGSPPTFDEALQTKLLQPPGQRFQYGPAPFQAFGAFLRRKYKADPLELLEARILKPANVDYKSWGRGADGQPHLSSGARLNARNWARFGVWVLKNRTALAPCFQGTGPNPAYGLTWWLKPPVDGRVRTNVGPFMRNLLEVGAEKSLPEQIWMAIGSGDQRLYLIPSQDMVIVRQTDRRVALSTQYSDRQFLLTALASQAEGR